VQPLHVDRSVTHTAIEMHNCLLIKAVYKEIPGHYEPHPDPLLVQNQSCILMAYNGSLGSRKKEENDSGDVTNFIALGRFPRNRFMYFLFLVRELTTKNKRNDHAGHLFTLTH
jgi:hypothetical protein